MFLSQSKTRRSDHPQTSKPAFLVDFSVILQPKKQHTRPHGPPGNAYLIVWKVGVTHTYAKEQPKGFARRILKEYHDRKTIKQLKR